MFFQTFNFLLFSFTSPRQVIIQKKMDPISFNERLAHLVSCRLSCTVSSFRFLGSVFLVQFIIHLFFLNDKFLISFKLPSTTLLFRLTEQNANNSECKHTFSHAEDVNVVSAVLNYEFSRNNFARKLILLSCCLVKES